METFNRIFATECMFTSCIFTDGSTNRKNQISSGYSVVLSSGEVLGSFCSAHFVSSYCVELMAILTALNICKERGWKKVSIFSDSLSSLMAVDSNFKCKQSSHILLEIKDLLFELQELNYAIKLI